MAKMERPSWLGYILGSLRTELAVASLRSLALIVASKLLVLLSSILIARWLGADGFGVYASLVAAALVLGVIAQLGLPTLLIRNLPVYEVREKWGLMRGLLQRSNSVVVASSLILAGIALAIAWNVGDGLSDTRGAAWLWAAALIPIASLNTMSASGLRGLRRVVSAQVSDALIIPGLLFLLVGAWWVLGDRLGLDELSPDAAIALRFAVTAVAFLVGTALLVKYLPPAVRNARPAYDNANWMRAALPLFFLASATIITTQTDVLMLFALQSNASAGVYQTAARGAELITFSLLVVSGVVQPTISRLHELGDLDRLQNVVTGAARFALVLALPVALGLAVFAEPLLELVYGAEFSRGAVCLMILSAAQVVNVSAGLVAQILIMTGHVRDAAIGMTLGAVVNVILNALLIPRWEIEGAAVATGISLVVWSIFLSGRVKTKTGLASGVALLRR